jgi:hypothetical protein
MMNAERLSASARFMYFSTPRNVLCAGCVVHSAAGVHAASGAAPAIGVGAASVRAASPPPPLPDALVHESREHVLQRQARFLVFAALPGGLTSLVVHLGLLIGLAVYALTAPFLGDRTVSVEVVQAAEEVTEDLVELTVDIPPLLDDLVEAPLAEAQTWDDATLEMPDQVLDAQLLDLLAPRMTPASDPVQGGGTESGFVAPRVRGGELATRAQRRRQALAYGATMDSEDAVDLALEWLVRHQRSDGSWSFQHRAGDHRCPGCLCSAEGRAGAENGATGMVLLALLGAGHTHLEGEYRESVTGGLRYLIQRQKPDGSLMDANGNMYSQGLATLALCEAVAMTRYADQRRDASAGTGDAESEDAATPSVFARPIKFAELSDAAQRGVQFIEYAQHAGGGWRYAPLQPGDTSIVGWQLMALKSGYLAGLAVDPQAVKRSVQFLDSVAQDEVGSCYGYMSGTRQNRVPVGAASATTAIGLLCRMYTGWPRNHPGMTMGVKRLMLSRQPNKGMYFFYYAMQVMHHYGGKEWREWNDGFRNDLVRQQRRQGREAGSWLFRGVHDDAGRLYCTAMAAMCLEVYYRYSPIYGHEAVAAAANDDG